MLFTNTTSHYLEQILQANQQQGTQPQRHKVRLLHPTQCCYHCPVACSADLQARPAPIITTFRKKMLQSQNEHYHIGSSNWIFTSQYLTHQELLHLNPIRNCACGIEIWMQGFSAARGETESKIFSG
jgi:hypothetical protein